MTREKTRGSRIAIAIFLLSPAMTFASTSFDHNGGQGTGAGGPHALTRMVKDGVITDFIYDDNGSLETETQDGVSKTYSYFVDGKLKQKTAASGQKTIFFTNTSGEKVAVYAEGGSRPAKTQIFQNSSLEFTNDVPRFTYGGDARTSEDGNTVHFFVKDHLGSIVATLSPNGVESRRDYLPYGQDWFREDRTSEDNGFNGNREEAGLLDYGARHYNPETGKFIEADTVIPASSTLGYNRYTYTANNPVNFIDPTGHSWEWGQWQPFTQNVYSTFPATPSSVVAPSSFAQAVGISTAEAEIVYNHAVLHNGQPKIYNSNIVNGVVDGSLSVSDGRAWAMHELREVSLMEEGLSYRQAHSMTVLEQQRGAALIEMTKAGEINYVHDARNVRLYASVDEQAGTKPYYQTEKNFIRSAGDKWKTLHKALSKGTAQTTFSQTQRASWWSRAGSGISRGWGSTKRVWGSIGGRAAGLFGIVHGATDFGYAINGRAMEGGYFDTWATSHGQNTGDWGPYQHIHRNDGSQD